jgi:hypothetical protein
VTLPQRLVPLVLVGITLGSAQGASAATYACHPVSLPLLLQFVFFVRNTAATPTTFRWTAYNGEGQQAQSSGSVGVAVKPRATVFVGAFDTQHFPGSGFASVTVNSPSDRLLVSVQLQRNALGSGDEGFQQLPCPKQ